MEKAMKKLFSRTLALGIAGLLPLNALVAQLPSATSPAEAAYAPTIDRGAAGLWQSLQKLRTRASLMMIVAHPDDEDGGMLAYESRDQGVDTTLLTLTRGEGGQNVVTGDYWDDLGLVRTQELLAADAAYGVRQRFTRLADFGFSKSLEETLKTWGHDRALYDVVREIRRERPLVLASVFAGNVSDGHGHHQTAGVLMQEAYKLAGDATVFPDQIAAGLRPWSPLKVYVRVPFAHLSDKGIYDYATGHYAPARFKNYVTGEWIEGVPTATVRIPEGTYQPLFGRSYIALAREGLAEQKTQNDGVGVPPAGPFDSSYHLYASRVAATGPAQEKTFFDGIDTTLAGIAGSVPAAERVSWQNRLNAIAALVEKATRQYDATAPEKSAEPLAAGLAATRVLRHDLATSALSADVRSLMDHELATKEKEFNHALALSLGLSLVATLEPVAPGKAAFPLTGSQRGNQPTPQAVVTGQSLAINLHVADQGTLPVAIERTELRPQEGDWQTKPLNAPPTALAAGAALDAVFAATVPADAEPTRPYFARPALEQPYYDLQKPDLLGEPTAPYPLTAHLAYRFAKVEATLDAVVQSTHRLNVVGPVLEPLLVAPRVSVEIAPGMGIVPLGTQSFELTARVRNDAAQTSDGTVRLTLPTGWSATPAIAAFHLTHEGEELAVHFRVTPQLLAEKSYTLTAVATVDGKNFSESYKTVGYAGLRPSVAMRPATYTTTGVDVKIAPGLRVGYVMGPGDEVPSALAQLGVTVTQLSDADLAASELARYDAILVGIRAYTTRAALRTHNARLLDYVNNGGAMIVEYQSDNFDAPFALAVPRDAEKVVEEDSPVSMDARDPLLGWPNQIATTDFDQWVEERGHGFAQHWAAQFTAPTSMQDANQAPQKGGLLWARSGKGVYIYAAYAFFREMPEGVPGSFRIMANLLSAGHNKDLR
jgi:LmbE family N-acetylglucosaminyl deacetylase